MTGERLQQAARQAEDAAEREERLRRKSAGAMAFARNSLLLTYQVNGKSLDRYTKAEILKKAAEYRQEARLLEAAAELMPEPRGRPRRPGGAP